MSKKRKSKRGFFLQLVVVLGVVVVVLLLIPDRSGRVGNPDRLVSAGFWQEFASPGELSQAHEFLGSDCRSCHTPVDGPIAQNCIVCHANNEPLLQRQPTSFHSSIESCKECHGEHLGVDVAPTIMDHSALSRIGIKQRDDGTTSGQEAAQRIEGWIRAEGKLGASLSNPYLSSAERVLDCTVCHASDDRHFGLFGQNCASCHSASSWDLPEFRHPAPTSVSCSQCHQAPPSHYMKHFDMISRPVAVKPEARVDQCYVCHQTTAWPDIKGVGWYKHH
ncbi:MAG: hypothetical protein JKX70_05230 [Phycisphaerales bacterium]|nr:hypothetical protein [Phycisphaerales bacterium]